MGTHSGVVLRLRRTDDGAPIIRCGSAANVLRLSVQSALDDDIVLPKNAGFRVAFGTLLSAAELAKIVCRTDGWRATRAPDGAYLDIKSTSARSLGRRALIPIELSIAEANNPATSDHVVVECRDISALAGVYGVQRMRLLDGEEHSPPNPAIVIGWQTDAIVHFSRNAAESLSGSLRLFIANEACASDGPPVPLVPRDVPWLRQPRFELRFASEEWPVPNDARDAHVGALTYHRLAERISVRVEHDLRHPWTVTPHAGANRDRVWTLRPTRHEVLGAGEVIEVAIDDIRALGPSGVSRVYVAHADIPGHPDSSVTLYVAKRAAPPRITSFASERSVIDPGTRTRLSWSTTGATRIVLSDPNDTSVTGGTEVPLISRSHEVAPARATTYTLQAFDERGDSHVRQHTIAILPQALIEKFEVVPSTVDVGQTAVVSFRVLRALVGKLEDSLGRTLYEFNGAPEPRQDQVKVQYDRDIELKLTVEDGASSASRSIPLIVRCVKLRTSVKEIGGGMFDLSWTTENATKVELTSTEGWVKTVEPNGHRFVRFEERITVSAWGPGESPVTAVPRYR